jgi:hypothetical protein
MEALFELGISASHGRLPGLQATHIERKHLRILRDGTCTYLVCPKDDGIRKLLICRAGEVVLLDRASNSTPLATSHGVEHDAVLDGELVGSTFLMFDALYGLPGRLAHLPLAGRLEEARRWVHLHGGDIPDLDIRVKDMTRWSQELGGDMGAAMDGGGADGVIMTLDVPMGLRAGPPTLKWKRRGDITVDFLMNGGAELCVIERGTLIPMAVARFLPSILASRLRSMTREQDVVVECEMGPNGRDWDCRKIQTDKDSPNSMLTYRNSLRNIAEDIRFEELFEPIELASARSEGVRDPSQGDAVRTPRS